MKHMKLVLKKFAVLLLVMFTLASCQSDIEIVIPEREPELVVEAYINNVAPLQNYVILGRSLSFFNPSFENAAVSGAQVTITEGDFLPNRTYRWDLTTKRQLREIKIPGIDTALIPGIYFDPKLVSDPLNALRGVPGKHYLLEITVGDKRYTATTMVLPVVEIDSLTSGYHFNEDGDPKQPRARLTVNYKDPDTLGNNLMYYWRSRQNRLGFGWGAMRNDRFANATDELSNGQYIKLTHTAEFEVGDTVSYYMVSVERKIYNFWNSYNRARANGGPFATPVVLENTISGDKVIGSFSGFSVSRRRIIVK